MLRCLPVQAGKGSATLSMAYAAAKFAESCVLALQGQAVVECAYVESHLTDLPFFASQVRLGPSGVEVRYLMAYPVCVWHFLQLRCIDLAASMKGKETQVKNSNQTCPSLHLKCTVT